MRRLLRTDPGEEQRAHRAGAWPPAPDSPVCTDLCPCDPTIEAAPPTQRWRGRREERKQVHTPDVTCPVLRTTRHCFASLDLVPRAGPPRNPEKFADVASVRCCSVSSRLGNAFLLLTPSSSLLGGQPRSRPEEPWWAWGSWLLHCLSGELPYPLRAGCYGVKAQKQFVTGNAVIHFSGTKLLFWAHFFFCGKNN